jgi:hypothetical protein
MGIIFQPGHQQYRMGLIMVVQAISKKEEPIEFIEIPENLPNEVFENDSLLTIESNINKLEDKVVLTARSLLGITNEMKIQLFEIERLEKTIISMHEYMVRQSDRITKLEEDMDNKQNKRKFKFKFGTGFLAKMFSK